MTALRTTRSVPPLLSAAAALVALLGLATGCGGPPPEGDAARPLMRPLPAPAAERIAYNPDTRTLTLYRLPASGRWLVRGPEGDPVAVGPVHVLPASADPVTTRVGYRRPTGQASNWVSVADIQAARATHASN